MVEMAGTNIMYVCVSQTGECEGAAGEKKQQRNRSERWGRDKEDVGQRGKKKMFPGWSPSQVSDHDVRSCLATVIRSLYRQGALFYFMYS